jgi:hypothetical protein
MPVLGHNRDGEPDYTRIYHFHFIKTLLNACRLIITSFFLNVKNFRPHRTSETSFLYVYVSGLLLHIPPLTRVPSARVPDIPGARRLWE